jgi:antitoxin HicB
MPNLDDYPFELRRLSADEGGGWLIRFPDFDECLSDGETVEEAIRHGREALRDVVEALEAAGLPVPAPRSALPASDALPDRLRHELTLAAAARGVAPDELMLSLLRQGLRSAA